MQKLFTIAAAAAFLAGCSTGVVPAGPDTYMLSVPATGFSTAGAAKAKAYKQASEWCARRGLVMVPVSVDASGPQFGRSMGRADLVFRALKPGDPDINRPTVEKPDYTERRELR